MQIQEIMTRGVECIEPDAAIRDAAAKMKELDIGPVPVCENNKLIGMLTDRDVAVRAVAEGKDPNSTTVRQIMTNDVNYCFEADSVEDAVRQMQEKQIRRLLVLNSDKQLVGIVSLGDLATGTHQTDLSGEALEAVSRPS